MLPETADFIGHLVPLFLGPSVVLSALCLSVCVCVSRALALKPKRHVCELGPYSGDQEATGLC